MPVSRNVAHSNYCGLLRCVAPRAWRKPFISQSRATLPLVLPISHKALSTSAWSNAPNVQPLQLRPYQEESIQAVLKYLADGETRLGISLATGSGKTVIFSHLIDRVPSPTPGAVQTLILAHRRELVEQAARHCQNLYPDKQVEIEMGDSHASGFADITVASVRSLTSERLSRYDPKRFKLLLVDEAHHIVAPGYLAILRHFQLMDKDQTQRGNTALVGVSATFSRLDGLKLGKAIDHIVYHKDYVEMIDDDWLAKLTFTTVKTGVDLSGVRTSGGDFLPGALSNAVNTTNTNVLTVRSWLSIASTRKSTLVFCVDISHVNSLAAMFRRHGIDARVITGTTDSKQRGATLASFKAGEFPVLLNVGIFTEGTDIPNIDCVLLARPTRSRNLLIQMIGRGLRKSSGKENCHVVDMVSSLATGIVTTPTLFGLDPDVLVSNADPQELSELRESNQLQNSNDPADAPSHTAFDGSVSFTHYDSVQDLLQDTRGEQHIRAISQYAWVQVDHDRFILSNTTGSLLAIKIEGKGGINVTYTAKLRTESANAKSPYARPFVVARTSTFENAVHAADTYASKKFVHEMIRTKAAWRKYPASPTQLEFLSGFLGKDYQIKSRALSKGQAADWITKMKHGARGRLNRMTADATRNEKIMKRNEKWIKMQEEAKVKVGPLVAD